MDADQLRGLLKEVAQGSCSTDEALERLEHMPFEDLGFAKVDHHRSLRHGMPEVILGRGKTVSEVREISKTLLRRSKNLLVTRASQEMADAVREREIETIAVAYNGSADPSRFVPGYRSLPPETPLTGWLAISLFTRVIVNHFCGGFRWLEAYEPVARIGRSIDLYHIEALKPETLSDGVGGRLCR